MGESSPVETYRISTFHFDKSYSQRALQSSTTDDALFTKSIYLDCKQAPQFGSLRRITPLVHNREGRVTPHLIVDCIPLPICLLRRIVQVMRAIQHTLDVLVSQFAFRLGASSSLFLITFLICLPFESKRDSFSLSAAVIV